MIGQLVLDYIPSQVNKAKPVSKQLTKWLIRQDLVLGI